jgi:hypothetical protein
MGRARAGKGSNRRRRVLAGSAVLVFGVVLGAPSADAILLPKLPVPLPKIVPEPRAPRFTAPNRPLATPRARPAPPPVAVVPRLEPVARTATDVLAPPLRALKRTVAPVLPTTSVPRTDAHGLPIVTDMAPALAATSAPRRLAVPPRRFASPTAGPTRSADALTAAGGSTIRNLNRGEVRIVPESVCSTQVASAMPESPALCITVTPEEAAELGLSSPAARSPFASVAGLAITGASIAGLVIVGLLALGLGGVARPFGRTRTRRRTAVA